MAPPLVFKFKCDPLKEHSFTALRGKEQISRPYEFEVFFTMPIGKPVRQIVGERATALAQREHERDPLVIHGVIAKVGLVHQAAERALYRALLVPRLWLLRHFWRSYVFTNKKVKDFLTDTLKAGGLIDGDFRFDIEDSYPEEEFVAQYRETHLDFFHRWLEREGLYYYFEHKQDAHGEVLVIVDDKSRHDDFPGSGRVRYFPSMGDDASLPEALHQLEADTHWLPKSVTIADYDYQKPSALLKADNPVTEHGVGTIRDYGYRVFDAGQVKRLAKVRAEAIGCHEHTLRAGGDALGPRAGYRFAVDDRPEDLDEDWLAVEVEHLAAVGWITQEVARLTGLPAGNEVYGIKLLAVPKSAQYRAPQTTLWPRVDGFENGIVCGPADSPYAQIDADGRYLVRFEFDTSDLPDAKISTRVRMLQPHGGSVEGFHFPLRKGTEVMIGFLGGDPDRPFIAGVVPNAHKPSVIGQRNHTQNIIRSGSNNQIVMEDQQGKEFIFVHTPNKQTGTYMGYPAGKQSSVYTGEGQSVQLFNSPNNAVPGGSTSYEGELVSWYTHTDGDGGLQIGGSFWLDVGQDENTFVGGNTSHGYKGTYTLQVGQATTEDYYANVHSTIHAGGMDEEITDHLEQKVHGPWTSTIDDKWDAKFGQGSVTITAEPGGTLEETATSKIGLKVHEATKIEMDPAKIEVHAPAEIEMTAGTKITIEAPTVHAESTSFHIKRFGAEDAAGIQKGEAVAIEMKYVGLAHVIEGVVWKSTVAEFVEEGMKKEVKVLHLEEAVAKIKDAAAEIKKGAIEVKTKAVKIWNGAFKKT